MDKGGVIRYLILLLITGLIAFLVIDGWHAFGAAPAGERLKRIQQAPNWRDGKFFNQLPLYNPFWNSPERWFESSDHANPDLPIATYQPDSKDLSEPVSFRVTWLGHSISLIEIDGVRFLTDPVWSERVSPYNWAGPRRWYPPLISIEGLPPIDATLISHDHYDHLDTQTIKDLKDKVALFIVPLGVGAHLELWGIPADRIVELNWWQDIEVGGVTVTATPARHASGRTLVDLDRTLWMGFSLKGDAASLYFSGDTGLFPEMKDIGDRLGPFDVTMIEVGAYGADWPDWHIGPEQAVLAHNWVKGDLLIPVHWALFNLARHGWTEPMERTLVAAEAAGYQVLTPLPGEPVNISQEKPQQRWWPDVPWRQASVDPIVATGPFDRMPLEEENTP